MLSPDRVKKCIGYAMILVGCVFAVYFILASPRGGNSDLPGQRASAVLHEGKVISMQPDGSLTVLDAETGKVLLRSERLPFIMTHNWMPHDGFEITPYENVAVIATRYFEIQHCIVRIRDGAPVLAAPYSTKGFMTEFGGEIFAITWEKENRRSTVHCLDTTSGEILWEKEVDGHWDNIFVDRDFIVLQKEYDEKTISVFDRKMNALPNSDFHGKLPERNRLSWEEQQKYLEENVKYAGLLFGNEFSFEQGSAWKFPGGGFAAVSLNREDENIYTAHFYDGHANTWKKPLESYASISRYLPVRWSFSADERFVVHANDYGRIVCRNAADGEIRWVYCFPKKSLEHWDKKSAPFINRYNLLNRIYEGPDNRRDRRFIFGFFYGDFYTEDKAQYEEDISVAEQALSSSGIKFIVDDKAPQFDVFGAVIAAIACWSTIVFAFVCTVWGKSEDCRHSAEVKLFIMLFLLNASLVFFFGGYDRALFHALMVFCIGMFLCTGHALVKTPDKANRNHSGCGAVL